MRKKCNLKLLEHQIFYLASPAEVGSSVEFDQSESRHMMASLRAKVGDRIRATDGCGRVVVVEIERLKPTTSGKVLEISRIEKPNSKAVLYLAILKPKAMEAALERCSELGLSEFVPVISKRSIAKLTSLRLKRLRRIAIEAMKQSLGFYLTEVCEAMGFEDAIQHARQCDLMLYGDWSPDALRLDELLMASPGAKTKAIWIGPEGGFSEEEKEALKAAGAKPFILTSRRLRSETAAISAISICIAFSKL